MVCFASHTTHSDVCSVVIPGMAHPEHTMNYYLSGLASAGFTSVSLQVPSWATQSRTLLPSVKDTLRAMEAAEAYVRREHNAKKILYIGHSLGAFFVQLRLKLRELFEADFHPQDHRAALVAPVGEAGIAPMAFEMARADRRALVESVRRLSFRVLYKRFTEHFIDVGDQKRDILEMILNDVSLRTFIEVMFPQLFLRMQGIYHPKHCLQTPGAIIASTDRDPFCTKEKIDAIASTFETIDTKNIEKCSHEHILFEEEARDWVIAQAVILAHGNAT